MAQSHHYDPCLETAQLGTPLGLSCISTGLSHHSTSAHTLANQPAGPQLRSGWKHCRKAAWERSGAGGVRSGGCHRAPASCPSKRSRSPLASACVREAEPFVYSSVVEVELLGTPGLPQCSEVSTL